MWAVLLIAAIETIAAGRSPRDVDMPFAGFSGPHGITPEGTKKNQPPAAKGGFQLNEARIVGGVDATQFAGGNTFKWITHLILTDATHSYSCGASLVTDQLLLTAAHCFAHPTGGLIPYATMTARVGIVDTSSQSGEIQEYETRNINCVMVHDKYSSSTYANDIAMVKLESPVSAAFTPVELATSADSQDGQDFLIAGWGGVEEESPNDNAVTQAYPDVLQIGVTGTISRSSCIDVYGNANIGDGNICGSPSSGVDACFGDSGGPLFKNSGASQKLYGIVSWGLGCASSTYPGVYTWVGHYTQWIADITVAMDLCDGTESDDGTEETTTSVSNVGLTTGGCRCYASWGLNDNTCQDGDAVYNHCGMNPACDGDNQGNAQTSWCLIESSEGCAPAGLNWDYCTIGLGLCEVNHYASGGTCHPCPDGTLRAAGDNPHDSNGDFVTTHCSAILCAEDEHVDNHACVACPENEVNEAGDSAAGKDTACFPKSTTTAAPTTSPTASDTPPPSLDGCVPTTWGAGDVYSVFEDGQPYRLRFTKDMRVSNFVKLTGVSEEACLQACVEYGNECRAVEFQRLNGLCELKHTQTYRVGVTPEKAYWKVFNRDAFCGGPVTTTPEPTTLPVCPTQPKAHFRKVNFKRLKHTWKFTIGSRIRATHNTVLTEAMCAEACLNLPNQQCRSFEYRDGSAAQDGSNGQCELKTMNSAETPPKPNSRWWLMERVIFDCLPQ